MNRLRLGIVKLILFLTGRKFKYIIRVGFNDGKTREVVVYSGGLYYIMGQYLFPAAVIVIPERLLKDFSGNVQRFVLEHELGHAKNFLLTDFLILLSSISVFFLTISVFGFLTSLLYSFPAFSLSSVSTMVFFIITTVASFIATVLISWFIEGYAEYSAIKSVGMENAWLARHEMWESYKRRRVRASEKALSRITHPSFGWVARIYKRLNGS